MRKRLSFAAVVVLKAVGDGHRFGLAVMRETGLPSGTVYPALARAEDAGLVRGRWEQGDDSRGVGRPRRRYYELTAPGREALTRALAEMTTITAGASLVPNE